MKKISLFILTVFALGSVMAQTVDDFNFVPPTSDNTGSIVFPDGTLSDYAGGVMMVFASGAPVSAAAPISETGSAGPAPIGSFGDVDLADAGEALSFAILMDGTVIIITTVDPPLTYTANMFEILSSGMLSFSLASGEAIVHGCTDASYLEFDASANLDNGTCVTLIVNGCMDAAADNYDATANVNSGCLYTGCMDVTADNYDAIANVEGDCIYYGCMDATACNYDSGANTDDASCDGLIGCTDDNYYEFNASATCDDGSCVSLIVPGCTDASAYNFNSSATEDDGSCVAVVIGCTNPAADNYDSAANTNDAESCLYSGINPWGPGGGSEANPTYITANNMSVLVQAGTTDNLNSFNDLEDGDILFAAYETSRLENEYLGYSEISGIQSAGAVVWTEGQVGIPVFGAGNVYDNGFEETEELMWLVEKADGVVYHVQILDGAGNDISISWENGEFALVDGVSLGAPLYDGCMDMTAPNFDPLATTDDGSCADPYSIGCMDEDKVNYAGPGANPTHENATNHDDVFGDNLGYNLNTHEQVHTGTVANFSDDSYCQDQVEGCTDAMAHNYNPLNTQNDNTDCDWILNGMVEYDVDQDGNSLGVDYNFGAVDPENVNDGILGSDFDNAQLLFDEGYLDVNEHVIDNLADVMEWIDMDEERDAKELADTIFDMQTRYDINDSTWNADYNANDLWWNTRYDDTLAAVAVWFAEDEEADSLELADTITDMQARYDANDLWWNTTYDDTLADVAVWFAEDEEADSLELADTIFDMQTRYDANDAWWTDRYADLLERVTGSRDGDVEAYNIGTSYYHEGAVDTENGIIAEMQSALDYHASPLVIDLHTQWNTIAYYLQHETSVIAQFEDQFDGAVNVAANINIVKNNEGLFYWPEFNFDGIGQLQPGQGYQVRVKDTSTGKSDFTWNSSIDPSDMRILIPTVPAWAVEMEVENHPNDVRTLVRVVNMLGQEVNPAEQFNGEVLLYMYNDGTVEKKMVE